MRHFFRDTGYANRWELPLSMYFIVTSVAFGLRF